MATLKLVKEAILALKDRTGSSVVAINKWLETEKKVGRFWRQNGRLSVCWVSAKGLVFIRNNGDR